MANLLKDVWSFVQAIEPVGYIVAMLGAMSHWIWKHSWYKDDLFTIAILDRWPIGVNKPNTLEGFILQPLGSHEFFIRITCKWRIGIKEVNFRGINWNGSNASIEKIEMLDLKYWDGAYDQILTCLQDCAGGLMIEFPQVKQMARGASLYFKVKIEAKQSWSGLVSFRALDIDGIRSRKQFALAFGMSYEQAINKRG